MDYLPLYLDLKQRPCLVVGGGEVARRKIELLLRAGATVYIVAPQLGEVPQRRVDRSWRVDVGVLVAAAMVGGGQHGEHRRA